MIQPGRKVRRALDRLQDAMKEEPFHLLLIVSWPDLSVSTTLTNVESEEIAGAMASAVLGRIERGEWRRDRTAVVFEEE